MVSMPGDGPPAKRRQTGNPQWHEIEAYIRTCKSARLRDQKLRPGKLVLPASLTVEEKWGKAVAEATQRKPEAPVDKSQATVSWPLHRWLMSKTSAPPAERLRWIQATRRYEELTRIAAAVPLIGCEVDLGDIMPDPEEPQGAPELVLAKRLTIDESTGAFRDHGFRQMRGARPAKSISPQIEDILDARPELARVDKALGRRHRKVIQLAVLDRAMNGAVGERLGYRAGKSAQRAGAKAVAAALDALAGALKIEIPEPKKVQDFEAAIELQLKELSESTPTSISVVINEGAVPLFTFPTFNPATVQRSSAAGIFAAQ
jgi:hypothetical protein